ncbi:hypothetical protein H7J77_15975 [Mycolicibacillus parakoreensis]|uniref:Thioesterase n=1 Tax=Mycolicibacillus parakoreensis TaxID=1069221 RepID=A0ABY3TUP8_9MYCO|nr:hypothetical protein [Mycolicibacillus parakoreensis]MCV7317036.1 hypothetical protein [Mycolicibacillus parakoreensis]ULN51368.1 hypothetical protein MIU77_10570 [Mycolicibacillus parakoreensis]
MADDLQVPAKAGADRFGEAPLGQTVAAAAALRRLVGLLLSLEHPHPAVEEMLARLPDWEHRLRAAVPPDTAPRLASDRDGQRRVYLGHAFDVGAFNPCFPEYRFDRLGARTAGGRVTFPLPYEGPPGLVHGGFLAVFFDCVIQHQSCAADRTGRTRTLQLTYRRPTPVLTELEFDIERVEAERDITSTARLLRDGEVLCTGVVKTVAMRPDQLSATKYGRRRPSE